MRSKTLIVFFVLILLISGVVAASGDDKKDDKKVEHKAIEDKKIDDKKGDKDDRKDDHSEIGDHDDDDNETESTETGDAGISHKKHDISTQAAVSMEALKGQSITDLQIHVPPNVTAVKKIHVKAYYANGTLKVTRNYFDKSVSNGVISLQFDDLSRGEKVEVRLQTDQYGVFESTTWVLLRPDLTVFSASVAEKVVVGGTMPVNVTVQEINGDMGAEAVIFLTDDVTVLDTRNVNLSAGGTAVITLSTTINSIGKYNFSIKITNAVPAEYNETNNIYPLVVSAVSPDLAVSGVTAPALATVGERFEALATISELSGNIDATATVSLLENGTVLDSRNIAVSAGSSGIVSLSTVFRTRGEHTLSVRITSAVPADYNDTNNIYSPLVVNAVSPDLAVTNVNAPVNVAIGQGFEVLATISELYGEIGANATVALVDNSIVLDSRILGVPAGGSDIVSLNGSLNTAGSHNLTVQITGIAPQDTVPGNNEQTIQIRAVKPPEPMAFSSNYYYQNTSLYRSRYITGTDYGEKGEEQEFREDEVISFTAVSNRSLTFPFRINISIFNETGEGNIFKETGVIPTTVEGNRRIFTKHYNESETTLTIGVDETGISVNVEGKANSSIKRSSGYKYWWFGSRQDWDVTANSSSGKLIRARETLQVWIELEDSSRFLGGNAATILGNESYTGGWVDTTDGRVEEQRTVWIYSGKASGDTVI